MSVLPMYSLISLDTRIHKKFTVLLYNFESNYNNDLVIVTITLLFAGIDILHISIGNSMICSDIWHKYHK